MNNLADLIAYYLECLKKERREEIARTDGAAIRALIALPPAANKAWNGLAAAVPGDSGRQEIAYVYAPCIQADPSGRKLEPLAGVFCTRRGSGWRPDPADIWLGQGLRREMPEDDLAAMRADLERAAAAGRNSFDQAVESLAAAAGADHVVSAASADTLKDLPGGHVARLPCLWPVQEETSYDRGLVRELTSLHAAGASWRTVRRTALGCLGDPPDGGRPSDGAVLAALENPAGLTFSQAQALAAADGRLTVITGPPGTGKTRLIAALAVQHLEAGKSLLLASKINTAVESAVSLGERLMGRGAWLRTGNADAREELSAEVSWLAGRQDWQAEGELFAQRSVAASGGADLSARLAPTLAARASRLPGLARTLDRSGDASLEWWNWLTRYRLNRFVREWEGLLHTADAIYASLPARQGHRADALRRTLDALVAASAKRLAHLPNALAGDSRARRRAFGHLARLRFPIAVTNLAVSSNLPLEPAVFDTLVVDEASTCDPASLLPLLYRARSAVIIGDPQQLPHITGEGWRQVEPVPRLRCADGSETAAEFGKSAYQLCAEIAGDPCRYQLTDHFRCPPPIIAFSNDAFYGGALRIHTPPRDAPIVVRPVAGEQTTTRSGSRMNRAQAEAAMDWMRAVTAGDASATYGIVTPYRAAADDIAQRIAGDEALAPLLADQRIVVGTAHRFQGSEVDHLAFVTVAGRNSGPRELRWTEKPNLFNVAVTRARQSLLVIVDEDLWNAGALPLTRRLSQAAAVMVQQGTPRAAASLDRVTAVLDAARIPHRLGCTFRGYPLDAIDAADPPTWAIRIHTWEGLQRVTPQEVLRLWDDERALRRWGVELVNVNPLNAVAVVSRWAADREMAAR